MSCDMPACPMMLAYLAGAEASAEADAAFLAFLPFFFGADASADAAAEADAIGADATAEADGAAAKADAANREATRAAMILDMVVPLAVNKTAKKNSDSDESASLTRASNCPLT